MSIVALSGATGFIGGAIARELVRRGLRVRAMVRPESTTKPLPGGVERVVATTSDPASLETLFAGAAAFVHCAGAVRGASAGHFERVNVIMVEQLAASAASHGVRRIVHVSSLAASQPAVSPYAASKHGGEQALLRAPGPPDRVILRPPAVYGAGDREIMPLLRVMARGFAPLWGDAKARFSMIHVDDLVAAIQCCLDRADPPDGIYELHDGHVDGYSMEDVIDVAESVFRRRIRRVRVPATALDVLAAANLRLARLCRYDPMLTPWKLHELRHPRWVCDNARFSAAFGWHPRITLSDGMGLALAPT